MSSKKRILVAMSGGIDSSVAAIKLHQAGYQVMGVTMKTWNYTSACSTKKQIGCCNLDTIEDARQVATRFGFPYMVLDIRKTFGKKVINNFTQEYMAGRTPNPCILCNTHIKWEALLQHANELGCNYIATGHYAQVRESKGRYLLYKSRDERKDQSYALWGLSQESLSRTVFPLGHLTKKKVRAFAASHGFDNLVDKSESYEICFIPDNNYRRFLERNVEDFDQKVKEGDFILESGKVVGRHRGYPFYTVGQRKGLNLALGTPHYVLEIDPKKNRVVVGPLDELLRDGMYVQRINMIKYPQLEMPFDATIKVRYNDGGKPGVLLQKGDKMEVFFGNGIHAIAPGQAAVFYEGQDVVGGGWIASSFRKKDHGLSNK